MVAKSRNAKIEMNNNDLTNEIKLIQSGGRGKKLNASDFHNYNSNEGQAENDRLDLMTLMDEVQQQLTTLSKQINTASVVLLNMI